MRTLVPFVVTALILAPAQAQDATPSASQQPSPPSTAVGMRGELHDLVLPGPELEAKPIERKDPLVLRVVHVWPHGTEHRYDLEYYGLEPGRYDLRDYLERKDGKAAMGLPAIPVQVTASLPPGQVRPHPLEPELSPSLGGYRTWMWVAGIGWLLGLALLLFGHRRRRRETALGPPPPRTLADRLRPMVEDAMAGRLDPSRRAELERLLLAHWRTRLGLRDEKPAVALAELKKHPEAGALLRQLEVWLHAPAADRDVDVPALLAPYRDAPDQEPATAGAR